jgi:tetratricopeptide (TPR) repeat protein/serine/threonine protein kinase
MQPRADQIDSILAAAVEMESEAERRQYLDKACAGDLELKRRLEQLIENHFQAGSFLESPALGLPLHSAGEGIAVRGNATVDESAHEAAGAMIGPYKLFEEIGEGGMGAVWMAQQTEPVKRAVALKLIKLGMNSKQVLARFEVERQALALMDHPNIAKVLDAGTSASGRPYFVMELVKGVPITKYCDEHRLTPKQRLELFVPVCLAVQHAHQKGIIHRDIKPSNILIAQYDGRPAPKVIDFGVAKATGQQLTDKTLMTGFGSVVGTLEYMSPEQAELNQLDIDTRSDIYSLGVVLYELLTGSTPLSKKRLKEAAFAEVLRIIREEEPQKPSTRLSHSTDSLPSVSAQRRMEPAKLTKLVRGELDWIVMKALEKDRNRRYETANGFAMDVQRYLADEPVLACPPSAAYRLRKFVRRNKTRVVSTGVTMVALFLVAGAFGWSVWREKKAAHEQVVRDTALDVSVENALNEAVAFAHDAKIPEFGAAMERAEKLLKAAGRDKFPPRLLELQNELAVARQLEDIATHPKTEEFFWGHEPDAAYAKAFADAGIDLTVIPAADAVRRIRALSIRRELVRALDRWSFMRHRSETHGGGAKTGPDWKQLLEIAAAADLDSDQMRTQIREALRLGDRKTLVSRAAVADVRQLPVESLVLLSSAVYESGDKDDAMALARRAVLVQPDDFWLNAYLGWWCLVAQPPQYDQAIVYNTACRAIRPRHVPSLMNIGDAHKALGHTDKAIAIYSQAIEIDPSSALALNQRAVIYGESGQYEKAIADLNKAIELSPNYVTALHNRGVNFREAHEYDKALADLNKALELDSRDAYGWSERGRVFSELHQPDKAVADCFKALELEPNNWKARYTRGRAYNELRQYDNAVADLTRAIELAPTELAPRCDRALAYDRLHQYDKAIADLNKAIELDPKNAATWNNLGAHHCDLHQYDKAIADLNKAIELDPKNAAAWSNRGSVYNELHQYDKALTECCQAIELDPKNASAWNNRGYAFIGLHQNEKAVADLNKAIELDPKYSMAWNNRASVYVDLGQYDRAIADCFKAIELDPENVPALSNRGGLYALLGQYDKALSDCSKAIELDPKNAAAWSIRALTYYKLHQYDKAIVDLNKAIELDPNYAAAWSNRGSTYADLGQYDKAIADCSQAIELDPKDSKHWNKRGCAYGGLGQWDKAIADFNKAIALNPKHAVAWSNRGWLYSGLHQYYRAIADCSQAIELDPKNPAAWNNRGAAYAKLRQFDKAISDCDKAIELDPNDTAGWTNRGAAYLQLNQIDKAIADLTKAIELDAKNSTARAIRAEAHKQLKQYEKAVADLTKAIELDPMNPVLWNNRGSVYTDLKQFDKAIVDLTRAIELDPKTWALWNNRALAFHGLHLYDKAIADYSKALERDAKRAAAWNNRGLTYVALKQYDKAIADYSKVIDLAPKNPEVWNNRGTAYAELGQWQNAASDLAKATELQKNNLSAWYGRAVLSAKLGDNKAYRQMCGAMLDSFRGAPPEDVRLVGWACAMGPENGVDSDRLVELAEKLASQNPKSRSDQTIFGAALYRAGRFEDAERRLNQAVALPADPFQPTEYTWFFLAMAHQRLGHAKEAREWLEKTQKQTEKAKDVDVPWNRHLTLELLRGEAEALLGIKEKKEPGDKGQQTEKKQ